MEKIGLEEWKALGDIDTAVDDYLRGEDLGDQLEALQERLVEKECMTLEDFS